MPNLLAKNTLLTRDLQLIILDKDGTIIDAHHYWTSMIMKRSNRIVSKWLSDRSDGQDIRATLCATMGTDLKLNRLKPNGPVGIMPRKHIVDVTYQAISHLLPKVVSIDDIEDVFKEIDQETAINLKPLLRILPGVETFLNLCAGSGIKLAIATTDITSRAIQAMEATGLSKYFQIIVGADQVAKTKPEPFMGDLILDRLNIDPKHCAMIGDHPVDIQMGINCHFPCNIGVLTGLSPQSSFKDFNCHTINSFSELSL